MPRLCAFELGYRTMMAKRLRFGLLGAAAWACVSVAHAQTADFSVPTETLTVGKASGAKLLEASYSLGDYKFFALNYTAGGGLSLSIFGSGKTTQKNNTKFRFLTSADAPLLTGKCFIRQTSETSIFGFSSSDKNSGLYKCDIDSVSPSDYAVEFVVPQFASTSIGGFMRIEKNDPHRWDNVQAKMRYKGVDYTATPLGIDPTREAQQKQPITGYLISSNGKPVGRLSFDFSGVQSDFSGKGNLIAPVAQTDGREAVIFLAFQLLAQPDMYRASNAF